MNDIEKLIRIIADYNRAINDLFEDPQWKQNHDEHYVAILAIQRKAQARIATIAHEVINDIPEPEKERHSRYIPGKKEFAEKYRILLLSREKYHWADYHKMPGVIAMCKDFRHTLTYNPNTSDIDICTFLINTIK